MPEYTYICDNCINNFSVTRSITKYKPKERCPQCKKQKHVRRNFQEDQTHNSVRLTLNEIKTVGHYAERQTEMKSQDELNKIYYQNNKYKHEKPQKTLPTGMKRVKRPKTITKWSDNKERLTHKELTERHEYALEKKQKNTQKNKQNKNKE